MSEASEKVIVRVFQCKLCSGTVVPYAGDGRFYFHRTVMINLPASVYVPRCRECNADYVQPELKAVIDEILEMEYKRHEPMIKAAQERLKKQKGNDTTPGSTWNN
jgi:hypothetical protein